MASCSFGGESLMNRDFRRHNQEGRARFVRRPSEPSNRSTVSPARMASSSPSPPSKRDYNLTTASVWPHHATSQVCRPVIRRGARAAGRMDGAWSPIERRANGVTDNVGGGAFTT